MLWFVSGAFSCSAALFWPCSRDSGLFIGLMLESGVFSLEGRYYAWFCDVWCSVCLCSVVLCVVEWKVVMLLGFVWCFVMRYCVVLFGL